MIFLTVGTYPIPFDRLVKAVDTIVMERLIEEKIFAQIGLCEYRPQNIEYVEILEKGDFDSYFRKAAGIISHAGIGTITMALDYNKPMLVMPRRKHLKEHVNDHQFATARKFEELGHILVAYTEEQLPEKLKQLKSFIPRKRKANPGAVADRIGRLLNSLSESR